MTCLRAHPSKWHRLAGLTPKPTLEASVSSSPSWFTWRCSCKLGADLPWDHPLRQVLFLVSSCRHHIRGLKEVSHLSNVPEPRWDGTRIWTQIFLALEQPSQALSSVDSLQGEIQVACKYLKELSMEEGVGWLHVALGQTQVHGEMGWWAGALSQETYTSPDSTSQHLDVLGQVPPSQGPRGHPRKPRDALLSWTKASINCRLVWQDWHPPHCYLASHCPLSWFLTVQHHVFFITWGKGSNYGTVPKIAFLQWSPKEPVSSFALRHCSWMSRGPVSVGRQDWVCRLVLGITSWLARVSTSKSSSAKWEKHSFQGVMQSEWVHEYLPQPHPGHGTQEVLVSGDYYCGWVLLAVRAAHSPLTLRIEVMDPETLGLISPQAHMDPGEPGFRVSTFIQQVFKWIKK